jgi:hypothetical protein
MEAGLIVKQLVGGAVMQGIFGNFSGISMGVSWGDSRGNSRGVPCRIHGVIHAGFMLNSCWIHVEFMLDSC